MAFAWRREVLDDRLSNWYIRRNRIDSRAMWTNSVRRPARQWAAHQTLPPVLMAFASSCLRRTVPSEVMYQNPRTAATQRAFTCATPGRRRGLVDEALSADMDALLNWSLGGAHGTPRRSRSASRWPKSVFRQSRRRLDVRSIARRSTSRRAERQGSHPARQVTRLAVIRNSEVFKKTAAAKLGAKLRRPRLPPP